MKIRQAPFFGILLILVYSCRQNEASVGTKVQQVIDTLATSSPNKEVEEPAIPEKPAIGYRFEYKKVWQQKDSFDGHAHKELIALINRTDLRHLYRLDSFLIPSLYSDTLAYYFPFPLHSLALEGVHKIVLFSYPTQSFAAYENGRLVLTGPTSMGKKTTKTPTGLFFCNWKSKETRSTVDNDWVLKWNFNISNTGGVGFHQYDLPGYPASHSCIRLLAEQAEFLYYWADQWKLSKEQKLLVQGTPVIIDGAYPFGQPRPWFIMASDPKAFEINEQMIEEMLKPYREKIMTEQQKRKELLGDIVDSTLVSSK
jgi:hypothetical protein